MSQALSLYRLQQIDSQIDHLQTRLISIQEILDNDSELQQLSQRAETVNARRKAAERALQQAEENVQNQHIKI
jgi:hypothetical protein